MNIRHALSAAVMQLLQPLVRVLLRHGMAYDEFAELARRAYVQVAERDFTLQGRKQTTSRISVITGLNRKEVARLQALAAQGDAEGAELAHTMNRAAKVVVGWMHEHKQPDGSPALLDNEQFAALVRRHSGDMPARAVLDELRHDGAVGVADDGRYLLSPDGYGPRATDMRKISLLGQHAADLLGTIEHNIGHPPELAYLQQRVFADHIPADRVEQLRNRLRETGLHSLAQARELLIAQDAGDTPPAPGARRVTLGVYYYEQPAPGAAEEETSAPGIPMVATTRPGEPT
jgi:CTP:molybdopterin cytidylyltransferase MocA